MLTRSKKNVYKNSDEGRKWGPKIQLEQEGSRI